VETKILPEDRQKRTDEFHLEIGRCSSRWAIIESGIFQWFERITKMPPGMARRIFYSMSGFDGRRRMFQSAIGTVPSDLMTEYLKLLCSKAGNYSGSRNKMAHGDVLFIEFPGSKHYSTHIILEGGTTWIADPPDEMVLTLDNLRMMTENFKFLAGFIVDSLNWRGDMAVMPSRWTELVRLLPNPAHTQKLDPTNAARIQLSDELNFAR
jgi:hypothetical protein